MLDRKLVVQPLIVSPAKGFAAPVSPDTLVAGALLVAGAIVFLWYAPASYQIYLALHVLAVMVWVGGDITLTTLGIVFEQKQDGPTLAALGRMGTWIGTRVYTPPSSSSSGSAWRWSRSPAGRGTSSGSSSASSAGRSRR